MGRGADGHEKSDSNITSVQASIIEVLSSDFIATNFSSWLDLSVDVDGSLREAQWMKIDGTSVCPINFRVPTQSELVLETTAESIANNTQAYDGFLKLPTAGFRSSSDSGLLRLQGVNGYLWTSTSGSSNNFRSMQMYFTSANLGFGEERQSRGIPVRCIQDEPAAPNQAPTADAGTDVSIVFGESVTLSGSGSSDTDGTIASYLWQKDSVDVGTDENLTLPSLAVGTHTYTLVVTDDDGESSSADSVVVTVNEAGINLGLYATGQTTSNQAFDDGYYKKGIVKTYTRGSDIVVDSTLNIEWQDDTSITSVNHADAILTCNNLTLGGYTDWRLPTIYEFITIVDTSRASNTVPAINDIFENIETPSGLSWGYWSATEHKAVTDTAFNINFSHGYVDANGVGVNMFVKCVRDLP